VIFSDVWVEREKVKGYRLKVKGGLELRKGKRDVDALIA
jgi:hypothetical protein